MIKNTTRQLMGQGRLLYFLIDTENVSERDRGRVKITQEALCSNIRIDYFTSKNHNSQFK